MIALGEIDLRGENDVVRAHQTARTVAAQLGFGLLEQTRIATAVAEISRNALTYGGGGTLILAVDDNRTHLHISVRDRGPGISDLDAVLSGRYHSKSGLGIGIVGTRRLMDGFEIESSRAGTRVEMTKQLPRRGAKVDLQRISTVRAQLASQLADDPNQEIRRLQRDVAVRDQRIEEMSTELAETNRGVIALYAELEDRAEYQRQAIELRARLVSEMGHELRTPLHSIVSISKFLCDRLDGELNPEQDKQVSIIHEVAEDLTSYVNDLLDLARTDAGQATVHVTQFTAESVVRAVLRITTALVRPGVDLRATFAQDLPLLASDAGKISQVLRNLVANAIKFTDRGHIEVRVSHAGGGRIAFEVADTGAGIAPEDHELIFREFAQVDGHVHPRMRGSGLGLPLSRRLADLLGGMLTVESEADHGSTFRFELPAVLADVPAPQAVPTPSEPFLTQPRDGRARILVIDDDPASRYVLSRWLDDRYEIEQADGGQQGIERAASGPDAIFLDVVMPDLTGFEVIERLKANPATRDIPVIVYTALMLGTNDRERLGAATAILRKSTSSRVADRTAVEEALVKAGIAAPVEPKHA